MPTTPFTARIDTDLKAELERIAHYDRRSAGFIAGEAIRNLVEERRATRALIDTGLMLVALGAPAVSSDDVHSWLEGDDTAPFPQP